MERLQDSRKRVAYLDGWRGLSILLVLIGHFFPVPGIKLGPLGVEFFFVLSGRLMAEILFIERSPLKEFFRRRVARIYPALAVYVLVSMLVLSGTFIGFGWVDGLSALTLTYNYAHLNDHVRALDHMWSLCVEVHAYAVLAMVAFLAMYRGWKPITLIAALTVFSMLDGVISYWISERYEMTYWRSDVHVVSVLVSALVFLAMREKYCPAFLRSAFVGATALAISIVSFMDWVPMPLRYIIGTTLLAVAVNAIDTAWPKLRAVFSCAPLVLLGTLSFSIYLWQEPFSRFVFYKNEPAAMMLTGALLAAVASFYMIERPARRWLNENWGKK